MSKNVYNEALHEVLLKFASLPEGTEIRVTAGAIALYANKKRHMSEHIKAIWNAGHFPKKITPELARELLQQMENETEK